MQQFKIQGEFITLQQFLKIEDIIVSGGEAKYYLQNNKVYVNQQIEIRRGRKLYPNDIVRVAGKEYQFK